MGGISLWITRVRLVPLVADSNVARPLDATFKQSTYPKFRRANGCAFGLDIIYPDSQTETSISTRTDSFIPGERTLVTHSQNGTASVRTPDDDRVEQRTSGVRRRSRVVVVDDDESGRKALGDLLQGIGYHVDSACDGAAALELVMSGPLPNLVITDLKMPVLDGHALLARLQEVAPDLPVVVLTGFGDVRTAVSRSAPAPPTT